MEGQVCHCTALKNAESLCLILVTVLKKIVPGVFITQSSSFCFYVGWLSLILLLSSNCSESESHSVVSDSL